jgi:fluoroacetyl-CoA thioesterase
MRDTLKAGMTAELKHKVVTANLVSHFHPDGPPVLGSPFMLLLMEQAAHNILAEHMDESELSVGIGFEFEHVAATPAGAIVVAKAEVLEVTGRKIAFRVEAHDPHEIIGRGRHVRAVVDRGRFLEGIRRKAAAVS